MKVVLTSYNPQWPLLFLQEKEKLEQILGDLMIAIEHVGSTAIPSIVAKPVIDILIGVSELDKITPKHMQKLQTLGYCYNPIFEKSFAHRRYFQKNDTKGRRTYQLHIVNYPSMWWGKMVLFRNYLQHFSVEAKAYSNHKQKLVEKFPDSVPYALAKTDFCETIEAKAYRDFSVNLPHVETARLYGYIPQMSCLNNYLELFQDAAFINCFGVALTPEQIKMILIRDTGYWNQYRFAPWVWFDKATHQFIGEGGLNHTTIEGKMEIELTYSLKPSFWGKGLAVEIGQYALDYAFNRLNLSHVMCFALSKNHQSLRVMEKLGFHYVKSFLHENLPHKLYQINQQ